MTSVILGGEKSGKEGPGHLHYTGIARTHLHGRDGRGTRWVRDASGAWQYCQILRAAECDGGPSLVACVSVCRLIRNLAANAEAHGSDEWDRS